MRNYPPEGKVSSIADLCAPYDMTGSRSEVTLPGLDEHMRNYDPRNGCNIMLPAMGQSAILQGSHDPLSSRHVPMHSSHQPNLRKLEIPDNCVQLACPQRHTDPEYHNPSARRPSIALCDDPLHEHSPRTRCQEPPPPMLRNNSSSSIYWMSTDPANYTMSRKESSSAIPSSSQTDRSDRTRVSEIFHQYISGYAANTPIYHEEPSPSKSDDKHVLHEEQRVNKETLFTQGYTRTSFASSERSPLTENHQMSHSHDSESDQVATPESTLLNPLLPSERLSSGHSVLSLLHHLLPPVPRQALNSQAQLASESSKDERDRAAERLLSISHTSGETRLRNSQLPTPPDDQRSPIERVSPIYMLSPARVTSTIMPTRRQTRRANARRNGSHRRPATSSSPEDKQDPGMINPRHFKGHCWAEFGLSCKHEDEDRARGDSEAKIHKRRRKIVSHFFGRNKSCTIKMAEAAWVFSCRKHYQRARYRLTTQYALKQSEQIRLQLEKFDLYRPGMTYDVTAGKKLRRWYLNTLEAVSNGHTLNSEDDNVRGEERVFHQAHFAFYKDTIQPLCVENATKENVVQICDMVDRALRAGILNEFPLLEFLPNERSIDEALVTARNERARRANNGYRVYESIMPLLTRGYVVDGQRQGVQQNQELGDVPTSGPVRATEYPVRELPSSLPYRYQSPISSMPGMSQFDSTLPGIAHGVSHRLSFASPSLPMRYTRSVPSTSVTEILDDPSTFDRKRRREDDEEYEPTPSSSRRRRG